jgi:hypothetical protein
MAIQLDSIALGEPRVNAKRGKSAQVTHQSGKPVVVIANVPLSCPFGSGTFQGDGTETRLTIDFGQLERMEAIFCSLDEQLVQAAITAKDSLWPKGQTPEQVRENYTSPLKEREAYSTNLRCKIDTEKVRCWSCKGQKSRCPTRKPRAARFPPASNSSTSGSCVPNGEPRTR